MKKNFDSEPVYGDNDKHIKTKIKLYGDKINTNFQGKQIPKENTPYKCLLLIMLDSVIRVNKNIILKHFWKSVNMKLKIIKWRILSDEEVHLMNPIVNLIMDLIMDLIMMNLIINLIMIKLLKVKTVF